MVNSEKNKRKKKKKKKKKNLFSLLTLSLTHTHTIALYWTVLLGSTASSGRRSELVIGGDNGLNSTAPLIAGFGKIRATYAVAGFQEARGGQESSFEAIRMSLGEANYNVFDHKNIGGTGRLKLRPEARKFIMLLTDEDSDAPLYPANFQWGFSSDDYGPSGWPSYTSGKYAEELKATIAALVANDATIYMFVDPGQGVSRKQFGDPKCDVSNSDFSNFDRQATIDCLNNNALGLSLVGGVLSRGKTARVFNVLDIAKPGFVNNFFTDAVRTVAKCQLRKRQADPNCVAYRCSPTLGCYNDYLCGTGCDQCKIGGKCYRAFDQNPAKTTSCEFCIPSKSKTAWSTCSGNIGTCQKYGCLANFGYCGIEDICTPACQRCNINGACIKANAANPNDVCLKCIPATNASDWSNTCPTCTPECKNGGVCTGTAAARQCNCENTNFLGPACDQPPTCAKPCKNGGQCVVDNASKGTTKCQCDSSGFTGEDCSVCDPMLRLCDATPTPTVACAPACENSGVCKNGACDCTGTGFMGTSCQTKTQMTCAQTCLNGGVCDTAQGKCDCSAVAFEGAACEKAKQDNMAVCMARCEQSCGSADRVQTCACDMTTNELSVTCKTDVEKACDDKCKAACPSGVVSCLCDASGTPKFECMLSSACKAKCDAQCPSGVATMCMCDEVNDKLVFQCQDQVMGNGAAATSSLTALLAVALVALMI
jgi:hypothetical protein